MTSFSEHLESATIQVADPNTGDRYTVPCWFRSTEGKRLNLLTKERLLTSTAISVEHNDAMFLGEVVACTQGCNQEWHVEVKVEQVLTGLQSLMALRARLLGEGMPKQSPTMTPVAVCPELWIG